MNYIQLYTPLWLIILRQISKIRYIIPTPKRRRKRLLRHKAPLPSSGITPLSRSLRLPSPIKPPLRRLKRTHLRLCIRLQKLLIPVTIRGWVCVCIRTRAFLTVGCRTVLRAIARGKGSFPASAAADVVEVGRAVGVGCGPFAADCGPPPILCKISIDSRNREE